MLPHLLKNARIESGFDLLVILKEHYCVGDRQSWWWPSFFSRRIESGVEVEGARVIQPDLSLCFAAILGQNTKYTHAASALHNLYTFLYEGIKKNDAIESYKEYPCPKLTQIAQPHYADSILQLLAQLRIHDISGIIRGAGFHTQKATRIILLAQHILQDFSDFDNFVHHVTKEWLLSQKGIGPESASSILNYALKREEMVVDSYTQRLLAYCGLIFESYEEMQAFLTRDLEQACALYGGMPLAQIMARLHGKIVECSKQYKFPKIHI